MLPEAGKASHHCRHSHAVESLLAGARPAPNDPPAKATQLKSFLMMLTLSITDEAA